MHTHSLERWQHPHSFLGPSHDRNERRTVAVMALTGAMMVAEVTAGTYFGSMALLADGWHMGTHLGALGITALAYFLARRHRNSGTFTFGTGKFGDLAGFSSALILALISLLIGVESVTRLVRPVVISYDSAIAVAALGLVVNLVSALLLREEPVLTLAPSGAVPLHPVERDSSHPQIQAPLLHTVEGQGDEEHLSRGAERPAHGSGHHDHNLRSAFLHVSADALTSVLAIGALLAGRGLGWGWMDPAMGLAGALLIAVWAYGLLRDSGRVLLDREADPAVAEHIRADVEAQGGDQVADLHLWRVGPGHYAAIVTVVTHEARTPDYYKALLSHHPELSHVTVEVQPCS